MFRPIAVSLLFAAALHGQSVPVAKLIENLGAEDFASRERASRDLERMGTTALADLRKAATDDCPERARRAYLIVSKHDAAVLAKQLEELECDGFWPWLESAGWHDGIWDCHPFEDYMPSPYYVPWQESREATKRLVVDLLRERVPLVLVRRMLMEMRAREREAWQRNDWGEAARWPGWRKE